MIIETQRFFIRELQEEDKAYILSLESDSSLFAKFSNDEEYKKLYQEVHWNEINKENSFNAIVFLKQDKAFVGTVCMQSVEKPIPELGIDIHSSCRNKGYGPEIIKAFCKWYAETYNISKIKARIKEENKHSIHVIEKLGATYEKPSAYFSDDIISTLKELLPDTDVSELEEKNVRDYYITNMSEW